MEKLVGHSYLGLGIEGKIMQGNSKMILKIKLYNKFVAISAIATLSIITACRACLVGGFFFVTSLLKNILCKNRRCGIVSEEYRDVIGAFKKRLERLENQIGEIDRNVIEILRILRKREEGQSQGD